MAAASTIAEPTAQRTRQLQAAPSPKTAIVAHGPILENRRLWIVATIRSFVQGSHQSGLQRNLRPAMGRPGSLGQVLRPNESENPLSAPGGRFAPPAAQRRGSGAGRCCIRSHEASIMCRNVPRRRYCRHSWIFSPPIACNAPVANDREDDTKAFALKSRLSARAECNDCVDRRDGFDAVSAMPEMKPQKRRKAAAAAQRDQPLRCGRDHFSDGANFSSNSDRAKMDNPGLDLLNHR